MEKMAKLILKKLRRKVSDLVWVVPDVNPVAHCCAWRGELRCKSRRSWKVQI